MIQTFVLFLAINIVLVTVHITISKLILLLIVAISTLIAYKLYNRTNANDKLIIDPFKQIQSIVMIEAIAKFISVLFLPSPIFLSIVIASIIFAKQTSMRSLCVLLFDIAFILQMRRNYIENKQKQLKSSLKIKKTNSIDYNIRSPPKKRAFVRTNEVPYLSPSKR